MGGKGLTLFFLVQTLDTADFIEFERLSPSGKNQLIGQKYQEFAGCADSKEKQKESLTYN